MARFKDFIHFGAYDQNVPQKMDCIRFCFLKLLQHDLDDWNTHRIRPSRDAQCPGGVRDELFYLPSPHAADCMIRNAPQLPVEVMDQLEEPRICDNENLHDYFIYLCDIHAWHHPPLDINAASELYLNLVRFL